MEEDEDGTAEGQLLSDLSVAHSAALELAQEVKQLRVQLHAKDVELAEQRAQHQECRANMQRLIDTLQAERQELLNTLTNVAADNLLREKERLELSKLHKEHAALRQELDAARSFLQQQECDVVEVQHALNAAKFSAADLQALQRQLQHLQEHWLPDMERLLHGCAMHENGAVLQREARQRSPHGKRHTTDSSASTDDSSGLHNEADRLIQQLAGLATAGVPQQQDPGVGHLVNLRAQMLHLQRCLQCTAPGTGQGNCMQPATVANLLREQQQELLALAHHLAAQTEGAAARVSAQERTVTMLQQQVQELSEASSRLLQEVPNLQAQLAASQAGLAAQQAAAAALKSKAKQQLEAVVKQNKLLRVQLTERHEALQTTTQQLAAAAVQAQAVAQQHQGMVAGLQQQLQQQHEQLHDKARKEASEVQQMREQLAVSQAASQAALQRAKAAEHASRAVITVLSKEREERSAAAQQGEALLVEVQQQMRTQLQAVMEAYATELQALHEQLIRLEASAPATTVQSLISPRTAVLSPNPPCLQRLHDDLHQLQQGMVAVADRQAHDRLREVEAQLQHSQRREAELIAENTQLCGLLGACINQPAPAAVNHDLVPVTTALHAVISSPRTPGHGVVAAAAGAGGGGGGDAGRAHTGSPASGLGRVADLIQTAGAVMSRLDLLEDRARMLSHRLGASPPAREQQPQQPPSLKRVAQPPVRAPAVPGHLTSPHMPCEAWPQAADLQEGSEPDAMSAAAMLPLQHEVAAMLAAMQRYSSEQQPHPLANDQFEQPQQHEDDQSEQPESASEVIIVEELEEVEEFVSFEDCDHDQVDAMRATAEKEQELAGMLEQSRARYKKLKAKYSKQESQQAALVHALQAAHAGVGQPDGTAHVSSRAQLHQQVPSSLLAHAAQHNQQLHQDLLAHAAQILPGHRALTQPARTPPRSASTNVSSLHNSVVQQQQQQQRRRQQAGGDAGATVPQQHSGPVVPAERVLNTERQQLRPVTNGVGASAPHWPARSSSHSSARSASALVRYEQSNLQNEGSFAFAPLQVQHGQNNLHDVPQQKARRQRPDATASHHAVHDAVVIRHGPAPVAMHVRTHHAAQQAAAVAQCRHGPDFSMPLSAGAQMQPAGGSAPMDRPQSAVPGNRGGQQQLLYAEMSEGRQAVRHARKEVAEITVAARSAEGLLVPAEVLNKAAQYAGDEGLARPSSAAPSSFRAAAMPAPPNVLNLAARYAGQEGQARPASAAPSVLRTCAPANQHPTPAHQPVHGAPTGSLTTTHMGNMSAEFEAGSDASSPEGRRSQEREYIDGWQRLQQQHSGSAASSAHTHGSVTTERSTDLSNLDSAYGGLEPHGHFEPNDFHPTVQSDQHVAEQQSDMVLGELQHGADTELGMSDADEGHEHHDAMDDEDEDAHGHNPATDVQGDRLSGLQIGHDDARESESEYGDVLVEEQVQAADSVHVQHGLTENEEGHVSDVTDEEEQVFASDRYDMPQPHEEDGMVTDATDEDGDAPLHREPDVAGMGSGADTTTHLQHEHETSSNGPTHGGECDVSGTDVQKAGDGTIAGVTGSVPASLLTFLS